MYRSYLLKNKFWAKKRNEKSINSEKIYIRHEKGVAIYATIQNKGVILNINKKKYFFNNFKKLDLFLFDLRYKQEQFLKIMKSMFISQKLRKLDF